VKALHRLALLLASSAAAQGLEGIKPGEWFEAPSTRLDAVKPDPLPPGRISAVMDSWSGGGYDTKRDRLMAWGGGHSDYSGNEVYAFDVKSLKWERLDSPSADVGGVETSGVYPDGRPRSRHTYNYVQYVSAIDRFCTFGGAGMYPSGQTGTSKTHCYDIAARAWERKADALGAGIGALTAEDPATGLIWMQGAGSNVTFSSWDPKADKWTRHNTYDKGWLDYYCTAALGAGKFFALGGGKALSWDLAHPDKQPVEVPLSGAVEIKAVGNPGLAWDPLRNRFTAWSGGKDLYVIDPASWACDKAEIASGNSVTPTSADKTGTYGRFRYIPSRDLFIAVNRTAENVYFFKPSGATAIRPHPSRAKAPAGHPPQGTWRVTLGLPDGRPGSRALGVDGRLLPVPAVPAP
jgi:hypothetical protein